MSLPAKKETHYKIKIINADQERNITMKAKKIFAVLTVMTMAIGMLTGCGQTAMNEADTTVSEITEESQQQTDFSGITLNVMTAGDTNMEELQNNYVAPIVDETYPGMKLNVTGAGPGDDGSKKIYDKLKAQKDAGKENGDIDVAIVHQGIMAQMIEEGLLDQYVGLTNVGEYLTSDGAKNALGTNVEGYVIPLFSSQTAIAYNSVEVQSVPASMEELKAWISEHPDKFGYNGVTGGMAGVSFVAAYLCNESGNAEQILNGPYDNSIETDWPAIMSDLKSLPCTITNGNQGTLDMLNRGEISMGPVWVDMFYTMQAEGRMSPDVKLTIPAPGMPGQPMYIVVPANAANKEAAVKFAELLGSPSVQAKVVVDQFNWYPGIDANAVFPLCSEEAKNSLFKDITADILSQYGTPLPLNEYKNDMMEAYENAR